MTRNLSAGFNRVNHGLKRSGGSTVGRAGVLGVVRTLAPPEVKRQQDLCLPFISSGVHQERRPVRRHW